ncbi:MAG: F0F1 ATP synthase subunit A [Flavobacteriales bacterium]|jgi:F-type H+-transporting ATPase subunit a|uniref:F0F1 ATP synthase subunit A n=1 Tax=Blattabacterium sp. (Mastotermes darwiniensis) TaxID=39768 RepID=UPI000231DE1C|nr:F0F1 ATP synthase subunit A [Blattabacterium sp. (Mastotermes darwiniensis)]AER40592.1 ATP synthase A subunit [Blattabacterium sp. (Mastotermes darwiniensis) str. MADAR]MDR1805089.1 F0F1 ATP synthase subunit A [Flavobacteriales bacterium]
MTLNKLVIFYLFFSIIHVNLFAKEKKNIDVAKTIIEHVSDSHDWDIVGNIKLSLPIFLWNDGLEVFLSSQFYYGKVARGKYGYYKMFQEKIYQTDSIGHLYMNSKGIPKNDKPWDFSITKNVVSLWISFLLLCLIFSKMAQKYENNQIKWNLGILLEFLILFIRNEIVVPNIGKKKYKIYFPFLLTVFFFILINNLIGIIPGFPNVTGNISITLVLAAITFIIALIQANKSYWKHTFWMPNVPIGIKLLLAPIELVSILIRPLTLCIRLFANISSGHIVILSFICLIFIFKSFFIASFSIIFGFFIYLLEIMVAFLQSFIFTTLSSLLIGISVKNYENYE